MIGGFINNSKKLTFHMIHHKVLVPLYNDVMESRFWIQHIYIDSYREGVNKFFV